MPDLEELGLPGLTHIVRGAVRLEKNAKLCYINTIDWSRLARNVSKEDHFISANKDIDQCLDVCPKDEKGSDRCRKLPVPTEDGINRTRAVCWTANHCQKGKDTFTVFFRYIDDFVDDNGKMVNLEIIPTLRQ